MPAQACAYHIKKDNLADWHAFSSTIDSNCALNKIHGFKPAHDYIKFLQALMCNVSTKTVIYLTVSIQDESSIRTKIVEFDFCHQNLLISLRSFLVRIVTHWHTEPSNYSVWFHVLCIYLCGINLNISELDSQIYDEKFVWLCYICCQTHELSYFNFRIRLYEGLCPSQSDLFLLAPHQSISVLFNNAINC